MKPVKTLTFLFLSAVLILAFRPAASVSVQNEAMLVRIAEIEIYRDSLTAYKAILEEEAEASVRLEPGVISIFPMYQQKDSTKIRILEIYAIKKSYQSHVNSPNFQKYKTTTLGMVKTLQLIDMTTMDFDTMKKIFSKLKP